LVASGVALGAVLLSVAALTGCGDQDDQDKVESAFASVNSAVDERDAAGVCAGLGPRARRQLGALGHDPIPCAQGARMILKWIAKSQGSGSDGDPRLEGVKLVTTAVATVDVDGRSVDVPFVKEGDRWKLDSFYGLAPKPSVEAP
jgi:hypothetical protein